MPEICVAFLRPSGIIPKGAVKAKGEFIIVKSVSLIKELMRGVTV